MTNLSSASAKNIVLSGYYGFNNVGDEAVLAGLIQAFRDHPNGREGKLRITVLSADPSATEREHGPGVAAFDRRSIGAVRRSIADCDLFASGGGSLLQDVTSAHSIFYYLGVVRAAQMMGKKTMLIAQGIGPLRLARSRKLTAAVASRCQAITVRDAASAALMRSIGVTIDPVVTADPALLLGKLSKDISAQRHRILAPRLAGGRPGAALASSPRLAGRHHHAQLHADERWRCRRSR